MNTVIDFKTGKAIPFGPELVEKAVALMAAAQEHGNIRIGQGVFLYDSKALIEHQNKLPYRDIGKENAYTAASFYIIITGTEYGNTVSPCHTPQEVIEIADQDVIEAITIYN